MKKSTSSEQQLVEWNKTGKSIAALFNQQVKQSPAHPAIIHNSQTVTYQELNDLSDKLAKQIAHIPEGSLIGICMERSIDMLVSILAVLKIGAAYVPIDPKYPADRIKFILSDTLMPVMLTSAKVLKNTLFNLSQSLLELDVITVEHALQQGELSSHATFQNSDQVKTNNLAYVIYTSGSTGKPKGVLIENKSLINYAAWVKEYLNIQSTDRFDCSSSFSFDFTITTSIIPLLFGATVVLCDEKIKNDPNQYVQYLQDNKITIVKLIPTFFNLLCDLIKPQALQRLRAIILGGENASLPHIDRWLDQFPSQEIYNEYGPTETTVAVTVKKYSQLERLNYVAIGRPAFNTRMYVLDENLQNLPVGQTGELYVSGVSVSRGYLHRKEMNKAKFIPNHLLKNPEESDYTRLYKTGDLAYWSDDGHLVCVGRSDDQIKLNGFRVEIGEIEHTINLCLGVGQAAVIVKEKEGIKYLVAFYTAVRNALLTKKFLRHFLRERLPAHMIPSVFIQLDAFPLTINGKTDKAKLLVESNKPNQLQEPSRADGVSVESKLADLWKVLLKLGEIDLDANFFDLGGNSLLALRVHKFLLEEGFNIKLLDIFQYPSVRKLAAKLDCARNESSKMSTPMFEIGTQHNHDTKRISRLETMKQFRQKRGR